MFTSKVWLSLILSFGVVVLAIGMVRGETTMTNYFALKDTKEVLTETIANLEAENENLRVEIEKIRKSTNYAQKVLREKYHITDENERIVFYGE